LPKPSQPDGISFEGKLMRRIISLHLCLLVLVGNALTASSPATAASVPLPQTPEHGGVIESKYDGFNYETVITLKKMKVTCGGNSIKKTLKGSCISLVASLHCPGIQLNDVRYAKLQLVFETKNWDKRHPLGERDLVAIADGEHVKLGTMKLVNQDIDSVQFVDYMRELLEVSVTYQQFLKLARAQSVEMQVGKTQFELRDKNLLALKDLNNRVKP
jgi:hypothetical protein